MVLFFTYAKKNESDSNFVLIAVFSVLDEGLWPKVLAIKVSNPFQPLFADEEKIVTAVRRHCTDWYEI